MPSIWRGSGEPITRSRNASRSATSCGRSEARKNAPLEVPPRIHMQHVPSDIFETHFGELFAHLVDVETEHAGRKLLALLGLGVLTRAGFLEHVGGVRALDHAHAIVVGDNYVARFDRRARAHDRHV